MKKIIISISLLLAGMSSVHCRTFDVDKQLEYCHNQIMRALKELSPIDFTMEPRNILSTDIQKGWNCRKASAEEWCSGFWPGILWMDYAYTREAGLTDTTAIRQAAEGYTDALEFLSRQPAYDHDLGFLVINSFLKGYEHSRNDSYRHTAQAAADTLATLFNAKTGTILSWPRHIKDYGGHNTIMDNMINLELLFWAAVNGGSPLLADIAVSHAITTMRHHFRPDGSSYHVAVYDTITGNFIKGVTHQGYADHSMWSRGQAWAIYGYTMTYRWTQDRLFLDFAQRVADTYLKRLEKTSDNLIPKWDMDDPRTDAPKDASAACVVASALLELSEYIEGWRGKYYHDMAIGMLADLSTPQYQSRKRNVAFLMHSTGHHPAGSEIDASIIYADYYYLEALLRAKRISRDMPNKIHGNKTVAHS